MLLLKEIISFIIKKHIFKAKLLESHVECYEICFLRENNQETPSLLGTLKNWETSLEIFNLFLLQATASYDYY